MKYVRAGAAVALALIASDVGARGSAQDSARVPPPALAQRVSAFMTAWQGRDLSAMYGFYCPAYQEKTPRPEFLRQTRLVRFAILEFRVGPVVVAGDRFTVTVWRKADGGDLRVGPFDSESQQVWLRRPDGSWCKEDEPLILPFPGSS